LLTIYFLCLKYTKKRYWSNYIVSERKVTYTVSLGFASLFYELKILDLVGWVERSETQPFKIAQPNLRNEGFSFRH